MRAADMTARWGGMRRREFLAQYIEKCLVFSGRVCRRLCSPVEAREGATDDAFESTGCISAGRGVLVVACGEVRAWPMLFGRGGATAARCLLLEL